MYIYGFRAQTRFIVSKGENIRFHGYIKIHQQISMRRKLIPMKILGKTLKNNNNIMCTNKKYKFCKCTLDIKVH